MPKPSIFDRYETYDPAVEGFGNPNQWQEAFSKVIGKIIPIDEARSVLGITSRSTAAEIKSAYWNLARRYHPDHSPSTEAEFKKINEAYKVVIGYNIQPVSVTSSTTVRPSSTLNIMPQLLKEIQEDEVEKYLTDSRYCAQEKHDGRRRIIRYENGITSSLNKKGLVVDDLTYADDCRQIGLVEFTLDGEEVGEYFYNFDILTLKGENFGNKIYQEKIVLCNFSTQHIRKVYTAYTTEEKRSLFKRLKENGGEGIVFKLLSGTHKDGYSDEQVKFKFYVTASVIVIRQNVQDSVGIAVMDGNRIVPIGNVSCMGHEKPRVDEIIEVRYLYACRSLYQPTYLGVRDDVVKEDCTIEKLKFKRR